MLGAGGGNRTHVERVCSPPPEPLGHPGKPTILYNSVIKFFLSTDE
jgi:hypothetical protein